MTRQPSQTKLDNLRQFSDLARSAADAIEAGATWDEFPPDRRRTEVGGVRRAMGQAKHLVNYATSEGVKEAVDALAKWPSETVVSANVTKWPSEFVVDGRKARGPEVWCAYFDPDTEAVIGCWWSVKH